MRFTFRSIDEPRLGVKWRRAFKRFWPAYRRWFLDGGEAERPTYMASLRALRKHMPELVPCYDQMVELAGGGDFAARFLAQYSPRPFFAACSQAVWLEGEPALVRNYDYSPRLCDGLVMRTRWNGRKVIAMTDAMSGVLDGINADGLAISLAFGGRRLVGEGFGISIVLRYVLETCSTVKEACEVLCRVPVHLAYNVAVVDKRARFATVMVAPGEAAVVTRKRVSTNHQGRKHWKRYAAEIASHARHRHLEGLLARKKAVALDDFLAGFLEPPLFSDAYARGYGTIFTSVYLPERGAVRYLWPNEQWCFDFRAYREKKRNTRFLDPTGPTLIAAGVACA